MPNNTSPLFRFYQWNDLHIRDETIEGRKPGYPRGNDKARWVRDLLKGSTGGASGEPGWMPDFIVSAGDIIDGEIATYDRDFVVLKSMLLEGLAVPMLPCLGNHENGQGEGMPEKNVAYDTFYGAAWHNYVYTVAGVAFVVIDSSGGHRGADPVTDARLAFARRALERVRGMPCFVITHIPLIPMREREVLIKSFGFSSWMNGDARLLELIESHADHMIAVLGGHLHITAAKKQNGIWHIVSSGTAGYPSNFASHEVFADRVHVRMHAAPLELVGAPDSRPRGNIHGKERHGVDFTDADHSDAESYVSGTTTERDLVIGLREGKRPDAARAKEPLQIWHERAGGAGWVEAKLAPPIGPA